MSEATGVSQGAPPAPEPVVAAPATPEPAAPAAAVPEAPKAEEKELSQGTGLMGASRRARERAERMAARAAADTERAEAARERALGQPRQEAGATTEDGKPAGGQFKQEEAVPKVAATPAPDAGALAPAKEGSSAPAPELVEIPLPDGHPLRDRGVKSIRVAKESEQEARNGVNAAIRARQLESERDELTRNLALLEARNKALSGDIPKYETDPKYLTLIEQVRAAPGFGDEMADQLLAAFKAREELTIVKAEGTASREFDQQRMAMRIEGDIMSQATQVLDIWNGAGEIDFRVPELIRQYFAACDQRDGATGRQQPPSAAEFFEWVKPAYRADPRVRTAIEQLRANEARQRENAIRAEERRKVKAEQDAQAAEGAKRRAGLPPTSRPIRAGTDAGTTPAPEPARQPAQFGQHRKHARSNAAEIGRRYGQPTR